MHGTNAAKPLIKIRKLPIRATYLGVLAHHVSLIRAEGMQISIPAFGSGQPFHTHRSAITIGEIVADGAAVEFALRQPDKPPLRFDLREVSLRDVGWSGALSCHVKGAQS